MVREYCRARVRIRGPDAIQNFLAGDRRVDENRLGGGLFAEGDYDLAARCHFFQQRREMGFGLVGANPFLWLEQLS